MSEDPLDKLIIEKDADAVSLDVLASTLQNFVRFTKDGELLFENEFFDLPAWKKILIYLLARKVIAIKKLITGFYEGASPREISEITGIPAKSISRDFSTKIKTVAKNESGKYTIPNYNIHKSAGMLK